jgi:serine/threonine protein phosphatase PrpC
MRPPSRLRARGDGHADPGLVSTFRSSERGSASAALAITVGLRKTANEDAGGWERFDRRSFYAVADAHFGANASTLAIDVCLSSLAASMRRREQFEIGDFRRTFLASLSAIEEKLSSVDPPEGSETTIVAVAVGWGRTFWGSYGDSRIYVSSEFEKRQMNLTASDFLRSGREEDDSLERLLECGEFVPAAAGSAAARPPRLMIATDGLPGCRGTASEEWSAEAIGLMMAGAGDVEQAASSCVNEALLRGGADNVCAIVIEPHH